MSIKSAACSVAKYTFVFALGYWTAGGCDTIESGAVLQSNYKSESQIEKKLEQYDSRLDYLENKVLEKER